MKDHKYNKLTQISDGGGRKAWFLCECGVEKEIAKDKVKSGHTKSCGCLKSRPSSRKEMEGKTFGRLLVLSLSGKDVHGYTYKCKCSCGTIMVAKGALLRRGTTKSCGCINRERITERNTSHGQSKTPLYKTWCGMKARCGNPNEDRYKDYGGRGIKVCERWVNSFENFRDDMGERPTSRHSLDRDDNDGDYSPDNCKWSDDTEQVHNRRKMKHTSSQYRGVHKTDSKTKPWVARVHVKHTKEERICIYVGGYLSEIEAAKAYDAKVIELGIKRHINFPEDYKDQETNILNKIQ